jgi:trans-2-enoyl-CoA reductase
MKAVQFAQFGVPHEVVSVIDAPEPGAPQAGEVAVEFLCSPINPADLLLLSGNYGHRPALPAFGGLEGVGRVTKLGAGVGHLQVGDRVLLPGGNWAERLVIPAGGLFPLPPEAPSEQLAMLTVNPPTAWGLLHDYVELKAGDWVLQNVGNSGVGTNLIVLARRLGFKTVSVVRRESAVAALEQLGGDVVLVDGPDLARQVKAAVAGGKLALGVDAIGGEATARIGAALDDHGTVVNYGLMSGQNPQLGGWDVVFRGVRLAGFWLVHWFGRHARGEIARVYGQLAGMLADGSIAVPIAARYPLSQAREALQHAAREGRDGKIMIVNESAAS